MKEKEIQNNILDYLDSLGYLAWTNQSIGIFDKNKGVFRKNKSKHQLNGVSDIILIIVKSGICFTLFIEVKSKDGRQSDNQKVFQKLIEHRLGHYYIARSVNDMKVIIDDFNRRTDLLIKKIRELT